MSLLDSILGTFGGNDTMGVTPPDTANAPSGLNPDGMRRISAGLAGGLSNVKNSPFAGQVAANAAGGAFEAGNKSDETAINQALKLRQIEQRRGPAIAGQGTRQVPYVPITADDYARIAPGAFWRHADGSLRIKGQPRDVTNGAP